ncbi:MAG: PaaI family thioesterase [Sedimentitalea sp.]
MALMLNGDQVMAFLDEVFPQVRGDFSIDHLESHRIIMRLNVAERHLRPGNTVSGPSMFALADVCVYALVMAMIGPKPLAVTTNLSIDFMRKPVAGVDLLADCTLLKLGKLLAVGDVHIMSEGSDKRVAHASVTYAIPPDAA